MTAPPTRSRTLRCGLIGANIGRSRFAAGLGTLCDLAGIGLDFTAIDTAAKPAFDFAGTVAALRAEGWDGVAITHPWKSAAADLIGREISTAPDAEGGRGRARSGPLTRTGSQETARRLGAVNTLIFTPDGIACANTDYSGFMAAWRHVFADVSPGCVAMAGAGGVARALAPALAGLGATEITVWDTDPARAQALAALVGPVCHAIPADRAPEAIAAAEGLVNATACGMAGYPASAFPLPLPNRPAWAFDAVYTPVNTRFLSGAQAAGARSLTGFDLFQHMALASFEALTGIAPDPAAALPRLAALRPKEEYDNA